ncbi:hypothetical protein N658DRAFT_445266 [Parathielavia hyrcaniae]|uniref:Uncharacterized protein n=1 Tax=Parathielavia hyrcaniae TaxID=113614 RepID=A0AAN6T4J2_9PEZI|nr:hypothetical protein N658DRAFT_445266 [Parathielavia hyrcaniae]
MASTRTNTRPLGQPSSPRRQGHATVPIRGSSIVHVGNRPVLPDAAKRRSLSKSLTEFFTKLRPSKRPERGGTARLTAEHASTRPTPLVGCRKKRSRSLGPHDPDTIPPDRWNTAITPPRRAHSSRDLYAAHRAHRHERRTLLSSGDFLGVTGANPYTGEPDIVTPPTSTSSAIVSSSLSSSSSSSSHQWETSHMPFPLAEWELGRLIAIPVDLRRLSEDCRRQQIFTGRVLELDNLDLAARYPSVCTRITTTTGFERSQPRPLVVGHLFGAMLDRLREAPLTRRALTPRALSRPTSTRSSTTRSSNGCSDRLGSPSSMQLSVWPSVSNLDLQTTKTTTSAWKMLRTRPEQENRIPLQPPKPGPDSVTMSLPTEQEAAAPGQENVAPTPVQHMHGAAADHSREKPDWAMRKTMRNFLDIHPTHHSNNEEPGSPRSSPTCTRTSTSPIALALPLAQPQPQPSKATTSAQRQDETAVTIARASARIAFTQNPDSRRTLPALMLGRTPPKAIHWPVSAPRPGRAKPASAAGTELTGPGSGQQGKGKGKKGGAKKEKKTTTSPEESEGGHKEKGKAEGGKEKEEPQKKKGKGEGSLPAAPAGRPEVEAWMRNAVTMLARVVGAYWQAVSPVFDGNSELRKRLDGAQATRGDAVVCVLAVVFLFLVASVGVWVVRGVVGLVRLLGELGVVLGTVAGLRY